MRTYYEKSRNMRTNRLGPVTVLLWLVAVAGAALVGCYEDTGELRSGETERSQEQSPLEPEALERQIKGMSEAEVRAKLGAPAHTSTWDSQAPRPEWSEAERQEFYDTALHGIWIYPDGIEVHFSMSGKVLEVTKEEWPG